MAAGACEQERAAWVEAATDAFRQIPAATELGSLSETLAALASRLTGRELIEQRRPLGATRSSRPPNCSMKPTL